MTFAYRYPDGATKLSNRTSWSPVATKIETPTKIFEKRPISGHFDRIYNAFEKSNAFEIVTESKRFVGREDMVVNREEKKCSSFDRADSGLAARTTPCTEEEVTNYYREKILYSQARQLFPLQEDLAEWISKTIGITYLSGDNFLDVLDNGVELCQMASVIQEKAKEAKDSGIYDGEVPTIRGRCWQRAARRSFFSRDNMENFILFCRQLGVHENLLFESDDLVLQTNPRQVILCLLEVARLVSKFGVEPPGLVQLEREIALEEHDSGLDSGLDVGWQFREISPEPDKAEVDSQLKPREVANESTYTLESEGSVKTDDSGEESIGEPPKPLTELDKRVQIMTRLMQRNCNCSSGKCSKLVKVKKVGEGRYNIAGRNVFIRLLKGRHMMVRVGGGWDTLEHFLSRHDPCQVRLIHATTPTQVQTFTLPLLTALEKDIEEIRGRRKSLQSVESSNSGRSTPAQNTPASSRTGSISGKISPSSSCSDNTTSNIKQLKKSMTLPLKENLNANLKSEIPIKIKTKPAQKSVQGAKSKPNTHVYQKPRKLSSPACFSTPNTPTNNSKISENRLKKNRSMSFVTNYPSNFGTLNRSSSANVKSLISPSDIEKSIRISLPHISDNPSKQFLHIKAKYRSPPPREVPPR